MQLQKENLEYKHLHVCDGFERYLDIMKITLQEVRSFVREILSESVKFRFPPMSIKGWVADALTLGAGVSPSQYRHHPEGSTIEMSSQQYIQFVQYLKNVLKDEYIEDNEKEEIKVVIDHIMKQLPSA